MNNRESAATERQFKEKGMLIGVKNLKAPSPGMYPDFDKLEHDALWEFFLSELDGYREICGIDDIVLASQSLNAERSSFRDEQWSVWAEQMREEGCPVPDDAELIASLRSENERLK